MIKLTSEQIDIKNKIETAAHIFEIPERWAEAIGLMESSLGVNQTSPTNCKGVFGMSMIAMRDLRDSMDKASGELAGIFCGVAFLKLLLNRHGSIEEATKHFCAPSDIPFYVPKVLKYMKELEDEKAIANPTSPNIA